MIETKAGIRIEVDLSPLARGGYMDRRVGPLLERAMLGARGGYAGVETGIVDVAEVRGDLLVFSVAPSESIAREMLGLAGESAIIAYAEGIGVHEDCRTVEDVNDERDEAEKRANDRFAAILEIITKRDDAGKLRALEYLAGKLENPRARFDIADVLEHFRADR